METASVRAGIEVYGSALRYAELERLGERYRLLRLGQLDFDFDVAQTALYAEDEEAADTVREALREALAGTLAPRLHVTLHPPTAYTFFTPLSTRLDADGRERQLRQEASLLMQTSTPVPLRLTADAVAQDLLANEPVEWYHVLALEDAAQERLDAIVGVLPSTSYRLLSSLHAAATAAEHAPPGRLRPKTPYTLAAGLYASHAEFTLCRVGQWRFSQYAEADAATDVAFMAAEWLRRLGVDLSAVGQLYVYGETVGPETVAPLEMLFAASAELLDPLDLVMLDADDVHATLDASAYVPCLGSLLA